MSVLVISFITVIYSIVSTFYALWEREVNISIYESIVRRRHELTLQLNHERCQVVKQPLYYFVGFFVTYVWIIVALVYTWSGNHTPPVLLIFVVIFYPLQGLWNFFAFAQPSFYRLRRAMPETSIGWTMWHTVFDVQGTMNSEASNGLNISNGSSQQPSQTNDICVDQCSVGSSPYSCQSKVSIESDFTDCANNISTIYRQHLDPCNDILLIDDDTQPHLVSSQCALPHTLDCVMPDGISLDTSSHSKGEPSDDNQ